MSIRPVTNAQLMGMATSLRSCQNIADGCAAVGPMREPWTCHRCGHANPKPSAQQNFNWLQAWLPKTKRF